MAKAVKIPRVSKDHYAGPHSFSRSQTHIFRRAIPYYQRMVRNSDQVAKNIEISVLRPHGKIEELPVEEIQKYVEEIEAEKQAEAEKKKPSSRD
ncbi:Proteasome subunit alpha type-4 [Candidozyma auris]